MADNQYTFENEQYRKTYWHTCSHILAQAVKHLYPDVKLAIGPAIDNGFYYDIDSPTAFTPEILTQIEAEMRKICKEKLQAGAVRAAPRGSAGADGEDEPYKVELINDLPEDAVISLLQAGRLHRPVRRPPPGLHRPRQGQRHQADRLQLPPTGAATPTVRMLQRIYGIAFPKKDELDAYLKQIEEAKKRDHRTSGQGAGSVHPDGGRPWLPLLPAQGHGAAEHPAGLLARGA